MFALGSQGVSSLEIETTAVNGKPIVCGDSLVFGAAPVFLPIVPVLVAARTSAGFGLAEGTAEFLACASVIGCFPSLRMARPASQMGLPASSFSAG